MTKPKLKGLATGIGSLPEEDVGAALDLIFKYTPEIPFWPQLPKRDSRESMVAQFSEGLPCIKVTDKGIFFSPENKEQDLEKFYEKIINHELEYFKISQDFARGLYAFKQRLKDKPFLLKNIKHIKCQITGPFTFAASINDENGVALLHNPTFIQAIIEALMMKALWQIKFLEEFGKIIVFIDEPYLGCFGSAYTPINREAVVKGLAEITQKLIKSGTVKVGVHCCGNTDWSIFTDIKNIDIISFDAYSYLDRLILYAEDLKKFFKRGGILCWGIVPTQEFTDKLDVKSLTGKIKTGIESLIKKGLDKSLLLDNLIISPSCGLGSLDTEKSQKIFELLSNTSQEIIKNTAL